MRTHSDSPLYRPILADAFRVAWHHKQLWLFGLFAGMAGFGGATDAFLGSYDVTTATQTGAMHSVTLRTLLTGSYGSAWMTAIAALLAVGFAAAYAWMTGVSIAALVDGVRKVTRGGEPHFSETLADGRKRFWPTLGATALARVAALLCYGAIGTSMVVLLRDRSVAGSFFYLGSFVLFTAIAVLASVTGVYATILIVAKGRKMMESIREAARFALRHWLTSVEMAILLALSAVAFTALAIVPVAMLSIPLIFLIAAASLLGSYATVQAMFALSAFMLVVAVMFLAAFYGTFQTAAWMLLWEEMAEGRAMAKVMRIATRLGGKKRK